MSIRNKKPNLRRQLHSHQNSYSQLEQRQLLAADFLTDSITSAELFTVEPTIDFMEVQWGEESRLAKSGEWLIWQDHADNQLQPQNAIEIGNETFVETSLSTSAFAAEDQKLKVTEELASGLFLLSGTDSWSYELVAETVANWIPNAVVEPNFILNVNSVPNDSDFGEQWSLNNNGQDGGTFDADIDAVEAWDISTGSSDVLIAVIDTGVDYTHPDLADNIWVNPGEIAGDGIDNDNNGFIDDVHGWNFVSNNNDPMDFDGHGTHVAGTIGAVGNNNLGVTGVSQDVSLVPIKFLASNGGTTANAIRSIEYANTLKLQGHNLVATNNSWGGGGFDSALEQVIENALDLDILFVAAAGNDGSSSSLYPGAFDLDNVISVAATDRNDQLTSFSNYSDTSVDLAAPGEDILSTVRNGNYARFDGTSMAAPHVTGAIALLAAAEPQLSALELRDRLFERVDVLPQLDDLVATSGRLNVHSLLDPTWVRQSSVGFDSSTYLAPDTINLELFDSNGFAAGATVTVEASSGDTETIVISATGSSEFFTSIQSVAGSAIPGDGSLQIASGDTLTATYFDADYRMGQPLTATDTAAIFVDDFANDASQATAVALPFSISGHIETLNDEDWFSFEAVEGLQYDFESSVNPGTLFWRTLSIYDSDGTTLLASDSTANVSLSWIASGSGTYFVSLSERWESTGTYELVGTSTIPEATVIFAEERYAAPGTVQVDLTDPTGFAAGASVTIEASSGDVETIAITATGGMDFSALISSAGGVATANDGILQITTGDTLTATFFDSDNGFGGTFTTSDTSIIFLDDHGHNAATATPINFPYDIVGTIEVEEDHDWFSFDAVAGKEYEFSSRDGSLFTKVLKLYDTDGTTELRSRTSSNASFSWAAPSSGTYYVSINDFGDNTTGTYEFTATEMIPETSVNFDETSFEAPGTVGVELIDPRGFTSGDTLTIETSSGDSETLTISAIGDLEFATSINSAQGNAILNDGTLQITSGDSLTVTFFDADDGFGGSYTTTDSATIFVDDFGDDADSANLLELPFDLSGNIEVGQEQDWFGFTAVEGMQYDFELTRLSLIFERLTLYDVDGQTELTNGNTSNGAITWIAPSDGTFFLSVKSLGSTRIGTYELTGSSMAPLGSISFDAETLIAPGPVNLNLTDPRGFTAGDTVSIAASSGDIETWPVTAPGALDFSTSISSVEGAPVPNDGILQVAFADTLTATYFDSDDGFGGSYSVTKTATILADDYGSDSASAAPINFPLNIAGELDFSGDEDWFSFDAVAGMLYEFEATGGSLFAPTLSLYGTDGTTEIASERNTSVVVSWVAPSDGVYFVSIDGLTSSIGTYELTGTASIPEATIAFTKETFLTPETIGIDLTDPTGFFPNASILIQSSSGDVEFVSIVGTGNFTETIFIDAVAGSVNINDGVLQVSNEDTLTVTFFDSDDGFGGTLTVTATTTILVDDHGDDALTASPFDLALDITGEIEVAEDEDWFSFNAVAGMRYEFEVSTSSFFDELTLYGLDGSTELAFSPFNRALSWTAPSSGVYFLSVKDGNINTGTYSLNGVAFVPEGTIEFDADVYLVTNSIRVDLTDPRGTTAGDTVTIETSSGDVETLVIPATGLLEFSSSISAEDGAANVEDGVLQISSGDTLTATFFDADDGFGGTIAVTDTATIFVDDHGNDSSTATQVSFPLSVQGHRELESDQDWFSFSATEGILYEFESSVTDGSLFWRRLSLFNVDGSTQLAVDTGATVSLSWIAPSSGTYYISMSNFLPDSGTYVINGTATVPEGTVVFDQETFLVPEAIGLTLTDPSGFTAGDSVVLETASGDSETIVITATGELEFSTSISSVQGSANPNDGILQAANGEVITATFFDSDDGFGGTFTATGSATVLVDQHGNDATTATFTDFPLDISGEIEVFGDEDWFSFNAVAGMRYDISAPSPLASERLTFRTLTLYDTDGTTELAVDEVFNPSISWLAPSDGTYFFSIEGYLGNYTGSYQLLGTATPSFLLGDANQDQRVNFLDISPFISLVQGGTYLPEADMNEDGVVNFLDISPFINELLQTVNSQS